MSSTVAPPSVTAVVPVGMVTVALSLSVTTIVCAPATVTAAPPPLASVKFWLANVSVPSTSRSSNPPTAMSSVFVDVAPTANVTMLEV